MNTVTGQEVRQDLKSRSSTFSMGIIKANNLVSSKEKINSLKSRHPQLDPLASTVNTIRFQAWYLNMKYRVRTLFQKQISGTFPGLRLIFQEL